MPRTIAAALAAGVLAALSTPLTAAAVTQLTWPRTYESGGVKAVVYQPQVKSWNNQTVLNGLAAVALTPYGATSPVYGTAEFTAYTSADYTEGTVTIANPRILSTRWPGQDQATSGRYDGLLRSTVQLHNTTIPLASLLASISAEKALPKSVPVNTEPPQIFESEKPAILVVFDGQPILAPIEGTTLKYAVNTNWSVIYDGEKYYLLDGDFWISATGANGPWSPATATPGFVRIPDNDNFSDIRQHLGAPAPAASQVPQVFVSTKTADMILIDGAPKLEAISGTQLSYVSNTESDLFQYAPTKDWYVLLSGRWFKSASLQGPWTFASNSLPSDFAKIPVNSDRGRVLVSVPNTPAAQYAGAAAGAPQIASVDPSNTHLTVSYGPGAPQFQPIAGTSMQYAVNTPYDVVKLADNVYYACYSGIWFSASSPTGPWSVASAVPSVIYTIPPSSPLYQDTYVNVYNSQGQTVIVNVINPTPSPSYNPSTLLLVGFTAGYMSGYWYGGSWVYGTGFYYPPYYYPAAVPIYYGYPRTYTGGAYYNTATGAYGRSVSAYGPYGGATAAAQYNPSTGTYARGATAYGPNGSTSAGSFYNPRYGVGGHTVQQSNPYGSWGHSSVTSQYGNAYGAHASTSNGSIGGVATSHGTTTVGKSSSGDYYAGHDGNVYSNQNGSWQKYNGSSNSWSNVNKPSGTTGGYNASSSASSYHPSSTTSSGSWHGSSSSMSSSDWNNLNHDSSARSAGSSGFSGFSGGSRGGGGGYHGR